MITQRIRKDYTKPIDTARTYYRTFFAINNISLSPREIDLISHIAINGNLYKEGNKELFITTHNSSLHTIYNMITPLVKQNILHKEGKKSLTVNPQILPDFNQPINLILQMKPTWTEEKIEKSIT